MCGIAGISGWVSVEALQESLRRLSHRGPDDSGMFIDAGCGVGLTHARLSIIDVSSLGHQPMRSGDGRVVLVFNGEIYNYRELREELVATGYTFRGHSDTEVLLALYLRYGGDVTTMLQQLNGVFAFAVWDYRVGALLLARDALGVKPLYFDASGGRFAFASEIKALRPLAPESREVDLESLHRYLSFLWCPGAGTPFKAVRKVEPGEAIWVRSGYVESRVQWYKLPIFRRPMPDLTLDEGVDGLVGHLRAAVHRQLVSDVPVGAFLSGGLDSSAVAALACERIPDLRCFTIDAEGGAEVGDAGDLPFAKQVATHLGVPLEVVRVDACRMALDLERMVAQLDEPLADPASLNVLYICQHARDQGFKVLLSGAGGDDLFTGYRRHQAAHFERYWHWLPASVRVALARSSSTLDQRSAIGRRIGRVLKGVHLEGDRRLSDYFIWARPGDLTALYSPAFRNAIRYSTPEQPMLDFLADLPVSMHPLRRMLALEQRFFLADHNLIYTDKMSMAVGVEVRVPLLDLELVDFAERVPLALKQRGMQSKWIFRKAMEPFLPRGVIYRKKTGFGLPLRRWIQMDLREMIGDLLSTTSLRNRGLFDPKTVERLIALNDSGRIDASYTLLSLLCIEIWMRTFLDRDPDVTGRH